jgi:probable rRNA maturation factor
MSDPMPIAIQSRQRKVRGLDLPALRRRGKLIARAAAIEGSEVSCTLVSDPAIHELNLQYRGKDKPTDVLSFAQNEGEFAGLNPELLGDVIISVEYADRQRETRLLLDEVTHLLIHGVLHLLGHDHEKDDEAEVMEAEERRIWAELLAAEAG